MGTRLLGIVREARWINADRVAAAVPLLLLGMVGSGICLAWKNPAWSGDYVSFWAASRLTLSGNPAAVYDPATHFAAQLVAPDSGWEAFLYPPIFLLFCWPLALVPFGLSFVFWLSTTGALWVVSIRRLIPSVPGALAVTAAFPAAWLNIAAGQNGFLTAALYGFGLDWLDRSPMGAGPCFGCLAYKPQFTIVVPVAFAVTGRWRVLGYAAVTAAGLAAASVAAFGVATWRAFLGEPALVNKILAAHGEASGLMVSVMGTLMSLHAPPLMAYGVQGTVTVATCVAMAVLAQRSARASPQSGRKTLGAAVCVCAVLRAIAFQNKASNWAM